MEIKAEAGVGVLRENVVRAFFSLDIGTITIDGKFGANTKAAIQAYQLLFGLDDDGVVWLDTWMSLLSSYDYICID